MKNLCTNFFFFIRHFFLCMRESIFPWNFVQSFTFASVSSSLGDFRNERWWLIGGRWPIIDRANERLNKRAVCTLENLIRQFPLNVFRFASSLHSGTLAHLSINFCIFPGARDLSCSVTRTLRIDWLPSILLVRSFPEFNRMTFSCRMDSPMGLPLVSRLEWNLDGCLTIVTGVSFHHWNWWW